MKVLERVQAALTPGSIFNTKGHVWRTVAVVGQFAGVGEEELLSILNGGDLERPVVYRASTQGKGLMVAFADLVEPEPETVKVVAGTAVVPEDAAFDPTKLAAAVGGKAVADAAKGAAEALQNCAEGLAELCDGVGEVPDDEIHAEFDVDVADLADCEASDQNF